MPAPPDLSRYSDEDIQRWIDQARAPASSAAPATGPDLSQYSDEDLERWTNQGRVAPTSPATNGAPVPLSASIARGIAQGASLGFSDEAGAAIDALRGPGTTILGQRFDQPDYASRYAAIRDFYRQNNAQAKSDNPWAYRLSELAGGLLPASRLGPSVAGLAGRAQLAALAKAGMLTGALAGLGYSDAPTLQGLARDTAIGGATGLAAAPVVQGISSGLGQLSDVFRKGAGFALSRVMGGIQRDVRPAGGAAAFANAGLEGREAGIINPLDMLPGAAERRANRLAPFAANAANMIETALQPVVGKPGVQVNDVDQALANAAEKLYRVPEVHGAKIAQVDALRSAAQRMADETQTLTGARELNAQQLQDLKESVADAVSNWDPEFKNKLLQGVQKRIYGSVADLQETAVQNSGVPLPDYQAAKQDYGLAETLRRFQNSAEMRRTNQLAHLGGLHGVLTGLAAMASGVDSEHLLRGAAAYAAGRAVASPSTPALVGLGLSRALSPSVTTPLLQSGVQSLIDSPRPRSAAEALFGAQAR